MSVSKSIINEEIQLKLHFQRISAMQVEEPLRFKTQNARMDFIHYCIKRGENLSENAKKELKQFISLENSSDSQSTSNQSIQQNDSNKKKLSLLFSHLAVL